MSVRADRSTVPAAGAALSANRDVSAGSILTFYPVHALGTNFKDGPCYFLPFRLAPLISTMATKDIKEGGAE